LKRSAAIHTSPSQERKSSNADTLIDLNFDQSEENTTQYYINNDIPEKDVELSPTLEKNSPSFQGSKELKEVIIEIIIYFKFFL
jgi:hypothetical protein